MHARTQGKSSDLIGAWARPTYCLESLLETRGVAVTHPQYIDTGDWQPYLGKFYHVNPAPGILAHHQPHPKACRCQCSETFQAKHLINWVGTQSHPSADRMPKTFLSPQPPLDTPLPSRKPAQASRLCPIHQTKQEKYHPEDPAHPRQARPYPGTS